MNIKESKFINEIYQEIENTPTEYLPSLLEIVKTFKNSIPLKSAEESFRNGMQEARSGETMPISELWKDIDA